MNDKAYEVEKISRCTSILLVHAENAQEAKRLAKEGEGEAIDAEYEGRGWGRVRRAPEYDGADR